LPAFLEPPPRHHLIREDIDLKRKLAAQVLRHANHAVGRRSANDRGPPRGPNRRLVLPQKGHHVLDVLGSGSLGHRPAIGEEAVSRAERRSIE
jgi:hypothetical protein